MVQVLGRATIRVDGRVIETEPGASLDMGGTAQKAIVYGRKIGRAEETKPAMIECVTAVEAGFSLDYYRNIKDASVTFECDTGQVYLVREGSVQDTIKITDGEGGKLGLKIFGQPADSVA